jgi:hypothetical protein
VSLNELLARRAAAIRRLYAEALKSIVESPIDVTRECDLTLYTFSCETHVPEQVASLRSLIRHLGLPRSVVVVSDGTHTAGSARLIERIHPVVSLVHYRDVISNDLPRSIKRFIEQERIGAKLGMEWSIQIDRPTMYADADVLFFPGIAELPRVLERDGRPRYLQDFDARFLDKRMLEEEELAAPTNSGVQLLLERLNWDLALERLETVIPQWDTEQTVVHLAMRASGGAPLPRDRYVLEVDDEQDWRDRYGGPDIALRHYCFSRAVQRKLWLNVWDDLGAAVRSSPRLTAKAAFEAALKWRHDRRRPGAPEHRSHTHS